MIKKTALYLVYFLTAIFLSPIIVIFSPFIIGSGVYLWAHDDPNFLTAVFIGLVFQMGTMIIFLYFSGSLI